MLPARLVGDRLGRFVRAAAVDDHVGTRIGQLEGHGPSDPRRRAQHDGTVAVQFHRVRLPLRSGSPGSGLLWPGSAAIWRRFFKSLTQVSRIRSAAARRDDPMRARSWLASGDSCERSGQSGRLSGSRSSQSCWSTPLFEWPSPFGTGSPPLPSPTAMSSRPVIQVSHGRSSTPELRALEDRWESYVYFRQRPFAGHTISIDSQGLRRTSVPPSSGDPKRRAIKVLMLGGSTLWGYGAGTIVPSRRYSRGLSTIAATPWN